jgi:hypothetical protein
MQRLGKRTVSIVTGTVVVLAGAGVAFAYWTHAGSGTATATTGTNSAITVNQTSVVSGLAPGLPAQALSGNFDNSNTSPVYVAGVTATVTGTDLTGCTASDYTIAGTAIVAAQVPAGTGVGAWSGLTIQFNNKAGVNQDACKNAVVAIAYASS